MCSHTRRTPGERPDREHRVHQKARGARARSPRGPRRTWRSRLRRAWPAIELGEADRLARRVRAHGSRSPDRRAAPPVARRSSTARENHSQSSPIRRTERAVPGEVRRGDPPHRQGPRAPTRAVRAGGREHFEKGDDIGDLAGRQVGVAVEGEREWSLGRFQRWPSRSLRAAPTRSGRDAGIPGEGEKQASSPSRKSRTPARKPGSAALCRSFAGSMPDWAKEPAEPARAARRGNQAL